MVIVKNRLSEPKVSPSVFVPFVGPARLVEVKWECRQVGDLMSSSECWNSERCSTTSELMAIKVNVVNVESVVRSDTVIGCKGSIFETVDTL